MYPRILFGDIIKINGDIYQMLTIGSKIKYAGKIWTIGAVGWVGERYYWLTSLGEVYMIPAIMLETGE